MQILTSLRTLFVPMLPALVAAAIHCILILHRIAGPLYVLRRTLSEASARDLSTNVRFRARDFAPDLPERWNEHVAVPRAASGAGTPNRAV